MRLLRSVGTWVLAGAVMLVAAGVARAQSGQGSGSSTNSNGGANSGGYSASQGGWFGGGQNSGASSSSSGSGSGHGSGSSSSTSDVPQTEQQLEEQQTKLRNAERQKQLVSDTQKLVALVNELQTDVDKSTKDTLSLDVVRKADEIDKLAKTVRDKMKNAN